MRFLKRLTTRRWRLFKIGIDRQFFLKFELSQFSAFFYGIAFSIVRFVKRLRPRRWRRWPFQSKAVLVCLAITIFQNTLYGIYLYRFSNKHKKFIPSRTVTIYCVTVVSLFVYFYLGRIHDEFVNGNISPRDTVKIYVYMNVCLCLFNYVHQWILIVPVARFQNRVPLFQILNACDISIMLVWRALILTLIKMIGCPVAVHVALKVYDAHRPPRSDSHLSANMTMIPLMIGNQLSNCFFGGIVVTNLVLAAINRRVMNILKEVNTLQTPLQLYLQKEYYRMRRFCELADQLDHLALMYTISTGLSKGYLSLTDLSIILSMTINFIGVTVGFYNQYLALADYYINEEGTYDILEALVHLVFLVVPFVEIAILGRVSHHLVDEAKRTGYLLQNMNLQYADIRFKQVVDAFWFQVLTIDYKLMPLGLLELNMTLVNKIFSAVTGFLLILIQTDLTLRFSLK
ncbi:putative gustatory receptor 97a [Drosophila willistoni]|uniref:putative gustatory receptor 97a n=1 Tax=Drosophila willistoni TaxID=7260 RepID=UPI000C26D41D|nr:putative gustatory receptor 97a [Drosophila willistoni]